MQINLRLEKDALKVGENTRMGMLFELTAPTVDLSNQVNNRKARSVVFVVDRSGSMSNGRLELVKDTIIQILPKLKPQDSIGVVSFDHEARVEVPVLPISKHNIDAVRHIISNLQPGGNTNMEAGMILGWQQIVAAQGRELHDTDSLVILLSDGAANTGETSKEFFAGKASAFLATHMVNTSTIGIGEGYNEYLLNAIATNGNGNHFAAYHLNEAVIGLEAEINDLLNKAIFDVELAIEIALPLVTREAKVVKLQEIKNWDGRHRTRVFANLGDLTSGESKSFVFGATFGPAPTPDENQGSWLDCIQVRATYKDLNGQTHTQMLKDGGYLFAANDWALRPSQHDVTAAVLLINLQKEKEAAIHLMRDGQADMALAVITQMVGRLEQSLANLHNMTPAQRNRLNHELRELEDMRHMHAMEFTKRGMESMNRAMKSRPDPRNRF